MNGDSGPGLQQRPAGGLAARVSGHLALFYYIRQINRVDTRNDFVMMAAP